MWAPAGPNGCSPGSHRLVVLVEGRRQTPEAVWFGGGSVAEGGFGRRGTGTHRLNHRTRGRVHTVAV